MVTILPAELRVEGLKLTVTMCAWSSMSATHSYTMTPTRSPRFCQVSANFSQLHATSLNTDAFGYRVGSIISY